MSSRVKLNYDLEQSVGDFFGVLGDGERKASVGEHARMLAGSRVLMLGCTF